MKTVTLSDEDFKKLVGMYEHAQRTPVIAMSVAQGMAGNDMASSAWRNVRAFMDTLGKKYGYRPQTARISMDSPSFEAEEA